MIMCRDNERGSIPVTLLTSIIVAGLIVVLVAAVIVNQRTARFDRSFTTVLQDADEYVQQAANNFIRGNWDPNRTNPVGTTYTVSVDPPSTSACPADDDGEVCATATKVSPLRYRIEATAAERTSGDDVATRKVSTDVVDLPRFFLAAFADTQIRFAGNSGATSYGAGGWGTGNGIVASNEDVRLNGASTGVDGVHLYNWRNYGVYSRCEHVGASQQVNDCNDVLANPPVEPSARFDDRLEVGGTRLQTQFIDDAIAACGNPLPSYTSSVNGSTLASTSLPRCVENLTLDTNVTVVGGPIEVYVAGKLSIANDVSINCPPGGCATGSGNPDATQLRIYSAGGDVSVGNRTNIVAAIYAPRSRCAGNPSSAQSTIFGSMICKEIANQGGWQFNYDNDLLGVGSNVWDFEDYREE